MKKLRVLLACEESQEVTKEFRELGHEAEVTPNGIDKRMSHTYSKKNGI